MNPQLNSIIPVQAACNTILRRSFEEHVSVTPMKLQKLLYFVYRDFLCKKQSPLFAERFQAWPYGPVLPSVYEEFKSFGGNRITKFAKNADGRVSVIAECAATADILRIVDSVWGKYKHYSGVQLSDITHRPGSAWHKAYTAGNSFLEDEDIAEECS